MSMSIIDSQEPAYRKVHEIDVLTKRIAEREANDGTRYSELFSTPERAAQTITRMQMATDLMGCCDADICPAAFDECWKLDACPMDDYGVLLEWLRGSAE